jgi:hypothetical protein
MGLRLFSEGSTQPPNPDPKKFDIKESRPYGKYVLVLARYPGCASYGGLKLLVYKSTGRAILERTELDPHFLGKDTDPIARFPASKTGWGHAMQFITTLVKAEGKL